MKRILAHTHAHTCARYRKKQAYEHIGDRIPRGQIVVVIDAVDDDDDIDDWMRDA